MFFFGRRLPEYAQNVSGIARVFVKVSYWIFPHVEFFDMRQRLVHGWGNVDAWVFLAVLGYGTAYVVALLALAHVLFKRKRL
jgi:hypothetical protein